MTSRTFNRALYISTQEAAKRLGVTTRTVQLWCDNGLIPVRLTVGKHRRLHAAHVMLLDERMSLGLPPPTVVEYQLVAMGFVVGDADFDRPTRMTVAKTFGSELRDKAWLLEQHNARRVAAGMEKLSLDKFGELNRAGDVPVHEAFKQGVAAATITFLEHLAGLDARRTG